MAAGSIGMYHRKWDGKWHQKYPNFRRPGKLALACMQSRMAATRQRHSQQGHSRMVGWVAGGGGLGGGGGLYLQVLNMQTAISLPPCLLASHQHDKGRQEVKTNFEGTELTLGF
jgi:hypothetical protein